MRRSLLMLALVAAALWSAPAFAQSRSQLGPLCTTDTTPADQQIDACNKIIALKVFSGDKLATIYFWRAVGWNKKGNYSQVISDASEALRLKPAIALYNLRGSAYYDKGEYDIAIADFNDALRIGPPSGIIFHNRGNALRSKGDYAKAIADYDSAIRLGPKDAFTYQNRSSAKQALGDLDGAPFINRFIAPLPGIRQLCLRTYLVGRPVRLFPDRKFSASILIPCRNERGNIENAIRRMPKFGSTQEILFVERRLSG